MFESFLEKSLENGPLAEKWQAERTRGLGRKTSEETGNGSQMTVSEILDKVLDKGPQTFLAYPFQVHGATERLDFSVVQANISV